MPAYVALLRGINLGNRRIKMEDLRAAFESWGYRNVDTLLASGNVVFTADETDPTTIKAVVEDGIRSSFGFESSALIRTAPQIAALVAADPANGIEATKDTKLHVTFLETPMGDEVELPYKSSHPDFEVRKIDSLHLFDIVNLGPRTGTLNLMDFLVKTFGDAQTTRTWNTVLKIQAKLEDL